jgi:hypothetical protein
MNSFQHLRTDSLKLSKESRGLVKTTDCYSISFACSHTLHRIKIKRPVKLPYREMSYYILTRTKSGPASLCSIVMIENFRTANSSNVKQFDTRLNLLFGLTSIQFLRRPSCSRELGRVNGTALLGPKRYFFSHRLRVL